VFSFSSRSIQNTKRAKTGSVLFLLLQFHPFAVLFVMSIPFASFSFPRHRAASLRLPPPSPLVLVPHTIISLYSRTPPGEYRNVFSRHDPCDRILSTQVCQSEHEAPRALVIKENYEQQIITGGDCMDRADWKRARGNSRSATLCCTVAKFCHHPWRAAASWAFPNVVPKKQGHWTLFTI